MPEIVPEAVIVTAAPLVVFVVGALKGVVGERLHARLTVLITALAGVAVAALVYLGGLVETGELEPVTMAARIVLAGLASGLAASGARSWAQS